MTQSGEEYMSEILAECIDMVMSGKPLAACFERFPEHAAELEQLLGTISRVQAARAVPQRDPVIADARRDEFTHAAYEVYLARSRADRSEVARAPLSWLDLLATRLLGPRNASGRQKSALFPIFSYLLLIAFTGILITGAVTASAAALPGDILYPVKAATENVQLYFTRDGNARLELQRTFEDRRRQEVRAVLQGRRVATLPLEGVIEELGTGSWIVAGLRITLTDETQIEGQPALGARVEGRMRAPGDGSLVALRVEVVAEAAVIAPPTPVVTPEPAIAPVATPTVTATASPTASAANGLAVRLPTIPIVEPPDPTATPIPRPTATATSTVTPSRTPTSPPPTATPLPAATPVSRPLVEGDISGRVMTIEGNRWLINEVWVETYEGTRYVNDPHVGSEVQARVWFREGQLPLAFEIIAKITPPPQRFAVTGIVAQTTPILVIRFLDGQSMSFSVAPNAEYPNGPINIGDEAKVDFEDGPNGRVAFKITKIGRVSSFVEGPIEEMTADHWIVNGRMVLLVAGTQVTGTPAIGAWARVNGYLSPDGGAIIAEEIFIN